MLGNRPHVIGNGPHVLGIMSHLGLCRSDYVAFSVMTFGVMSFGIMSHSGLCHILTYVVRVNH